MSKTPAQKLTNWQNHYIKQNMPEGLTDAAQTLFKMAVSKITVIFPSEGGSPVSIERLSAEEAFAIGETGTPSWSIGIPKSVRKKLDAATTRKTVSKEEVQSVFDVISSIDPETASFFVKGKAIKEVKVRTTLDEATKYQILDEERKSVLVTLHGQKFAPKKPKGSMSRRTQYIHKLVADNPSKKAKELSQLEGVRDAIGKMSDGTFANHLSVARMSKK
jgi:hypothetical protein